MVEIHFFSRLNHIFFTMLLDEEEWRREVDWRGGEGADGRAINRALNLN